MIVAETPRLLLRQFHDDDAADLMQVFDDPEVMRFGEGPRSIDWVRAWLQRCQARYRDPGFAKWAVVERDGGGLMGYCGLSRVAGRCGPEEAELGFRLARQHWGWGYATEAARASIDHGFAVYRPSRVIAIIDPGNQASIRVVRKLSMRYEREAMFEGYDHPDHVYVLDRLTRA